MVYVAGSAVTGAAIGALSGVPAALVSATTSAATGAAGAAVLKKGDVTNNAVAGAASGAAVTMLTTAAAGVVSSVPAALGTATAIASGPIGWLVLGAEDYVDEATPSWDCWKAVVHDTTSTPSRGRLLRELVTDPQVKQVDVSGMSRVVRGLPQLILHNVYGEKFSVDCVTLPCGTLAAHAVRIKFTIP